MAETLEEPPYEVINAHDGFEVRRYGPTVQARVQTAGRDGGAASGGFRRVAGYIFGGNSERTSIAMTAPVHMWEEDGSGWLAFTMPSAYAWRRSFTQRRRCSPPSNVRRYGGRGPIQRPYDAEENGTG